MKTAILVLLLSVTGAAGMDRLAALSQIESGDNDLAHGKAGEVSRWQILKSVWKANTAIPIAQATNAITAQHVALKILTDRIAHFTATHHRPPTDIEVYRTWNPRSSRATAQRYANLCQTTP